MDTNKVFKAYDVRGRTDLGDLGPELFELIGSAIVTEIGATTVAIGRDCRASSDELAEALTRGITGAGADVIDIGQVPTDAVYFFSGAEQVHGAMITASHNPAEYNGLKLCRPGAAPIGVETGLAAIEAAVADDRVHHSATPGNVATENIVDRYIDHLFGIVPADSIGGLRVAVDAGNGMAGVALEKVFERTGAVIEGLYLEPDGTFPNHPADPLVPENLADLEELMEAGVFDLGVAFDGDADRAFFLDEHGVPLSGSTVTALIAKRILQDSPGASIVHNLITSKAVPEVIREHGGSPVRTRVGHSFIKQVMAETGAVFGGEHSGHYYFAENFRADSGMLATLHLLRILTEDGRPLSAVRQDVERYSASGEINFEVADPTATIELVAAEYPAAEIDRLDGLTVDLGSAWFNLRPSNTEPLLRLNAEAPNPGAVQALVDSVAEIVEAAS